MPEKFSHGRQFTGYMAVIYKWLSSADPGLKILDIPAGNGLLGEKLKALGHRVTLADINNEKNDFVYADMAKPLPFEDNEFDVVICMEGIEHVLEPVRLICELCRICRPQGQIIITTPNIQNMYSRLQFMCTGTFYQFPPVLPAAVYDTPVDLGHISPMSFMQLQYLFQSFGATIDRIGGDRYKRKLLIPFLWPFIVAGYAWVRRFKNSELSSNEPAGPKEMKYLFSLPLLFSRSVILGFVKQSER